MSRSSKMKYSRKLLSGRSLKFKKDSTAIEGEENLLYCPSRKRLLKKERFFCVFAVRGIDSRNVTDLLPGKMNLSTKLNLFSFSLCLEVNTTFKA